MSRNELSFFNNDFDLFNPFSDDFFKIEKNYKEVLRTDIVENENDYELIMEVPGFLKENININVQDGYLTIEVNKNAKEDVNKKKYLRKERRYFSAKRSFYVGDIEEDQIKAKLENGELHITVPKEQEKVITKKQINIE